MAKTNELLSAVEEKSTLVVNSVTIEDDAVIIRFTSDGTDKKKTMPLTEKGLLIKEGLQEIFSSDDFDPNSIWDLIKPGTKTPMSGMLADCVIDLAKGAKEKQAKMEEMFKKLGLSQNPIDNF